MSLEEAGRKTEAELNLFRLRIKEEEEKFMDIRQQKLLNSMEVVEKTKKKNKKKGKTKNQPKKDI